MEKKLKRFSRGELKDDFYPLFIKLINNGFGLEAFLLMLSTWNFARFRYAVKKFRLSRFRRTIDKLELTFSKFKRLDFKTIKFDKYEKEIKKLFRILSNFPGVEKTGATKLMHLRVPKVFVMWDGYIRKHYGLEIGNADEYFDFLNLMQEKFRDVRPKLIDEHNYITITVPALRRAKRRRRS